jgi:uncharacterized DUF497 family protein
LKRWRQEFEPVIANLGDTDCIKPNFGALAMADELRDLLDFIRTIEWSEQKAETNRDKHGIDFDDAVDALYRPVLVRRSDRNNEERWLAIGETNERAIAVVFTWRGDTLRIISARRARKNEERSYRNTALGRTPKR